MVWDRCMSVEVADGYPPGSLYAVGVGANRGDRMANLTLARRLLEADGHIQVVATSSWYQTAAVGGPRGQDHFTNGVWILRTAFGPHHLLHRLQAVETACGRARSVRWGPRTLDLDLLLRSDGLRVDSPVLTLPHPMIQERSFVLEPLAEVAGGWMHPCLGLRVDRLWRDWQQAASSASAG